MGKKHREGFTLIELLVLMMVLALALGIGIPALNGMIANSRISGAANGVVSSLHAARAEASARSRTVVVCASATWNDTAADCSPDAALLDGWIVFADGDADGRRDEGEALLQAAGPLAEIIRTARGSGTDSDASDYLAFRPDGLPVEIAGLGRGIRNIQLCDPRGDADTGGGIAAGRWIAVSPAGRPVLHDRVTHLADAANPLGGC